MAEQQVAPDGSANEEQLGRVHRELSSLYQSTIEQSSGTNEGYRTDDESPTEGGLHNFSGSVSAVSGLGLLGGGGTRAAAASARGGWSSTRPAIADRDVDVCLIPKLIALKRIGIGENLPGGDEAHRLACLDIIRKELFLQSEDCGPTWVLNLKTVFCVFASLEDVEV